MAVNIASTEVRKQEESETKSRKIAASDFVSLGYGGVDEDDSVQEVDETASNVTGVKT